MSLHNGIDIVSIISCGIYTETYGSATQKNICNLYASLGLYEDAPDIELIEFLRGLMKLGLSLSLN